MKYRFGDRLLRFWQEEFGLSIFLALLVLMAVVIPAFGPAGPLALVIDNLVLAALLITGALTLPQQHRWLRWIVLPTVVITLLIRLASLFAISAAFSICRELSTLVALVLFAAVVAAQVYRSGPVTQHRIQGAIAVYLLLGITWAQAYSLLYQFRPGAFSGAVGEALVAQTWSYFSFVTLTTTGYGDILPVHPLARSLVIAEALTGQLYIAITLARLVGMQVGVQEKH